MAKMYLESNNAGLEVLITDEKGRWFYAPSGSTYGDADLYPDAEDSDDAFMKALYNIRTEIAKGTTYNAEEFLDDMNEEEMEEREVKEYKGCMNIGEVDEIVNYTTDYNTDITGNTKVRLGHDESFWVEV